MTVRTVLDADAIILVTLVAVSDLEIVGTTRKCSSPVPAERGILSRLTCREVSKGKALTALAAVAREVQAIFWLTDVIMVRSP